jgi:predicted outer membrane repeat protein
LTVQDAVVSGNTAGFQGGGIAAANGSLTVRNSTISGNVVQSQMTSLNGAGGILVFNASLLIENSTISGNSTTGIQGPGGGVYVSCDDRASPNWVIRNSTISGNRVFGGASRGGGIAMRVNASVGPALVIQNCTIVSNTANSTQAGFGGGGVARIGTAGTLLIESTIIANNTNSIAPDLLGTATVNFSLVRNLTGATITGGNNLPAGTDPLLGPLANNGGPTPTMAPLNSSPVIDRGSNPAGLTTDQRGPGFARVGGGAADIGAYEIQPTGPTVTAVVENNGAAQRSVVTSIQVTFSTVVTIGPGAFTLTYLGGPAGIVGSTVGGFTVSTATIGGVTVATLSGFTGTNSSFGSLIDGRYSLRVTGSAITANGVPMVPDFTYADSGQATGNQLFRFYGDVNGDRVVNGADFALFRTAFGTGLGDPNYIAAFDLNGDGFVGGADFALFRTNFGGSV